jgi:MFS family permease
VRISAEVEGSYAMVEVADTGPGIADEIRSQLFQPFVSHGKKNGLGLGLALARQTLLDHGGDLWAAPGEGDKNKAAILQGAYLFKVSPFWLIFAYMIVTLGELMLSPMGLSLVSKVAPISKRGLLMGGWFVATAIGNKLTMIGIYWDIWLQSSFFLTLACMALFMAVVLFAILKPLKKAMPGV